MLQEISNESDAYSLKNDSSTFFEDACKGDCLCSSRNKKVITTPNDQDDLLDRYLDYSCFPSKSKSPAKTPCILVPSQMVVKIPVWTTPILAIKAWIGNRSKKPQKPTNQPSHLPPIPSPSVSGSNVQRGTESLFIQTQTP